MRQVKYPRLRIFKPFKKSAYMIIHQMTKIQKNLRTFLLLQKKK